MTFKKFFEAFQIFGLAFGILTVIFIGTILFMSFIEGLIQ